MLATNYVTHALPGKAAPKITSVLDVPEFHGGEGGIRTHRRVSPTLAFEASSFNRSDTSPQLCSHSNGAATAGQRQLVWFCCRRSFSRNYCFPDVRKRNGRKAGTRLRYAS